MMLAVNRHLSGFVSCVAVLAILISSLPKAAIAQMTMQTAAPLQTITTNYLDPVNGKTVDDLVILALQNNADVVAMRREAEAGEALVKQAGLRPNPAVE